MVIAAFLSGSKGGTGKTTLCVLAGLLGAERGIRSLIVDLGESGNATSLLAEGVEPPYFTDYLLGKAYWGETIVEVRRNLYLAPTPPDFTLDDVRALLGVDGSSIERYSEFFSAATSHVDVIYIDFPAFPFKGYGHLLSPVEKTILVVNPDPLSYKAALHTYTGTTYVVPVLNKYHPSAVYWRDKLEEKFNNVVTIPFDVTLSFLLTEHIDNLEEYIERPTRDSIVRLSGQIYSIHHERPVTRLIYGLKRRVRDRREAPVL